MLPQQLREELQQIIYEKDTSKQIESLRKKISKWQQQKKKCKTAYDKTLCISRLNQMIQDARNKIKKLQGKQIKPTHVYGPY
jgi:hypothetical protein